MVKSIWMWKDQGKSIRGRVHGKGEGSEAGRNLECMRKKPKGGWYHVSGCEPSQGSVPLSQFYAIRMVGLLVD